jgi:hypothetical protein
MATTKWEPHEIHKRRETSRDHPEWRETEYLLRHEDVEVQLHFFEDGRVTAFVYGDFSDAHTTLTEPGAVCSSSGCSLTPRARLILKPAEL